MRRALLPVFALAILAACTGDDNPANPVPPVDASVGDNAVPTPVDPLAALPIAEELKGEGLSAPVDVVRDDAGIPHIYADNIPDAKDGKPHVAHGMVLPFTVKAAGV